MDRFSNAIHAADNPSMLLRRSTICLPYVLLFSAISGQVVTQLTGSDINTMAPYDIVANKTNSTSSKWDPLPSLPPLSPLTPDSQGCEDNDNTGVIVGVTFASLIVGIVIGALAMYFFVRFRKIRKRSIPPKDYNESESSALDVNMNNGETTCISSETVTAPNRESHVKGHKKLERLSKQGLKPAVPPKPILASDGSRPPIYIGPSSDNIKDNEEDTNDDDDNTSNKYEPPPTSPSLATNTDTERNRIDGDGFDRLQPYHGEEGEVNYGNTGWSGSLAQPYDSLDVIPEEVEYANTQEYEEVGLIHKQMVG